MQKWSLRSFDTAEMPKRSYAKQSFLCSLRVLSWKWSSNPISNVVVLLLRSFKRLLSVRNLAVGPFLLDILREPLRVHGCSIGNFRGSVYGGISLPGSSDFREFILATTIPPM